MIGRMLDRFAHFLFGRNAPDVHPRWYVAGNGTHGGQGGQTPPLVPYSRDWDLDNRVD